MNWRGLIITVLLLAVVPISAERPDTLFAVIAPNDSIPAAAYSLVEFVYTITDSSGDSSQRADFFQIHNRFANEGIILDITEIRIDGSGAYFGYDSLFTDSDGNTSIPIPTTTNTYYWHYKSSGNVLEVQTYPSLVDSVIKIYFKTIPNNNGYHTPGAPGPYFFNFTSYGDTTASSHSISGAININTGVNIIPGTLSNIRIQTPQNGSHTDVQEDTLFSGDTLAMVSRGFDRAGNYISPRNSTWALSDTNLGTIQPAPGDTVNFIAEHPGNGVITATDTSDSSISDDTGIITVEPAPVSRIKIRTGPDGTGDTLRTLSASDTLFYTTDTLITLYAAGYDAFDNYVEDVKVAWDTVQFRSNSIVTDSAISRTFRPTVSPDTGRIVIQHNTFGTDTTRTLVIRDGEPHHLTIQYGSGADAPVVNDTTLTSADSLTLYSALFDINNNFIRLISSNWTLSDSTIGDLSESQPTESIVFTARKVGTGTIEATDTLYGNSDLTGIITVEGGDITQLRIRTAPDGGGEWFSGPDTVTITTDSTITLFAAGYDTNLNYIANTSVYWSTGDFGTSNAVDSIYAQSLSFNADQAPDTGQIIITDSLFTPDTSKTIMIIPGRHNRLTIQYGPDSGSEIVRDSTMHAGESLRLYSVSYDQDGNFRGLITANWSLTDSIGAINNTPDSQVVFTAQSSGTTRLFAEDTFGIDQDETGIITVLPGDSITSVKIRTASDGGGEPLSAINNLVLTPDSSISLFAAGYDSLDNYVNDVSVTWRDNFANNSINSSLSAFKEFQPVSAPDTGKIWINYPGQISDTSNSIIVEHGALDHIVIQYSNNIGGQEVNEDTITAGVETPLYCVGYDAEGNFVKPVEADWTISPMASIGILTQSTASSRAFFRAQWKGTGYIHATYESHEDQTGLITVVGGDITELRIKNGPGESGTWLQNEIHMTADDNLSLFATGYDQYGNYIDAVEVDWNTLDFSDNSIDTSPDSEKTFYATVAPDTGKIFVNHDSYQNDTTGTIFIRDGNLSQIEIHYVPDPTSPEVGDTLMHATDSLTLFALAYDSDHNFRSRQSVTWSLTNTNLGSLTPESPTDSLIFIAENAGTGRILATETTTGAPAQTGIIEVTGGTVSNIKIRTAPNGAGIALSGTDTLELSADEQLTLYAAGYDLHNNYVKEISTPWNFIEFTGNTINTTSDSIKTFYPLVAPDEGRIITSHADFQNDTTKLIVIQGGILHHTEIQYYNDGNEGNPVNDTTVVADDSLVFQCVGYDNDGNFLGLEPGDWNVTGGIGIVNPILNENRTTFTAQHARSGHVHVEVENALDDATGLITVLGGDITYVRIHTGPDGGGQQLNEVDSLSIDADTVLTLFAAGYDKYDNYRQDVPVTWNSNFTSPTNNSLTGTAEQKLFYPVAAPDSGNISIYHAEYGVDTTVSIFISHGQPDFVWIQKDTTSTDVDSLDITLTAGESVNLYSVAYDADGNWIGTTSSAWENLDSSIGFLQPNYGTRTTYTGIHSGLDLVTANPENLEGDDIFIYVEQGKLDYIRILRDSQGDTNTTINEYTTVNVNLGIRLYSAGYDTFDNYIENVNTEWYWKPLSANSDSITTNATILYDNNRNPETGHIISRIDTLGIEDTTATIEFNAPPELRYISGSLTPTEVYWGDTVGFSLDVENTGGFELELRAVDSTYFQFTDNAGNFYRSYLADSSITIYPDSASVLLNFAQENIPDTVYGGHYTPEINITGIDQSNLNTFYSQRLYAHDGLDIIMLEYPWVQSAETVTIGQDSVEVRSRVVNPTGYNADSLLSNIVFASEDAGYNWYQRFGPDTVQSIAAGDSAILTNWISIDSGAAAGSDVIKGNITGKINSLGVTVPRTDNPWTWTLQNMPDFSLTNIEPDTIITGQSYQFDITLANDTLSAGADIDSCILYINILDTAYVKNFSELSVLSGGMVDLPWDEVTIPYPDSILHTALYDFDLVVFGKETNANMSFVDTVSLRQPYDKIFIQSPPDIHVTQTDLIPDRMSDSSDVQFLVRGVVNQGGANAILRTARLSIGDNTEIDMTIDTLLAPDIDDLSFDFPSLTILELPGRYQPVLEIHYQSDDSSFDTTRTYPLDSITVDRRVRITIDTTVIASNPDTIYQNQENIPIRVKLINHGSARGVIATGNNNYSLQYYARREGSLDNQYTNFYPEETLIIEGEQDTTIDLTTDAGYVFSNQNVDLLFNTRYYDGNSLHPQITNIQLSTDTTKFHSWWVKNRPLFIIDTIYVSDDTVTERQTRDWVVIMRLTNRSGDPTQLDSSNTGIRFINGELNNDTSFVISNVEHDPDILTVAPESSHTIRYTVDTTGIYRGNRNLEIKGILGGIVLNGSNFPIADTTTREDRRNGRFVLLKQGQLSLVNILPSQMTVDSAQSDSRLRLTLRLENRGETALKILNDPIPQMGFRIEDVIDSGYHYSPPDSQTYIPPGNVQDYQMVIHRVGDNKGWVGLDSLYLEGYQKNDDSTHIIPFSYQLNTAAIQFDSLFLVQSPANLGIDSLWVLPSENNVIAGGKDFILKAIVSNRGEGLVERALIKAYSQPPLSVFYNNEATFTNIDSAFEVSYSIQSSPTPISAETFYVEIDSNITIAFNTRDKPAYYNRVDSLNITIVDSVPPAITKIRYQDGGWEGIPDGRINSEDGIIVYFDSSVHVETNPFTKASTIFSVWTEGDSLGSGAQVLNLADLGRSTNQFADRVYINLGTNPVLATNSSTNRPAKTTGTHTYIGGIEYPTRLIINEAIPTGLVTTAEGADLGHSYYRDHLHRVAEQLSLFEYSDQQPYSIHAVLYDDNIPPFIINPYPQNVGFSSYISPFTSIKAFISGRNFVYEPDLQHYLQGLFEDYNGTLDSMQYYLNAPREIPGMLKTIINTGTASQRQAAYGFRDSLLTYYRYSNKKDENVIINPLRQMFTNLNPKNNDAIQIGYANVGNNYTQLNLITEDYTAETNEISFDYVPTFNVEAKTYGTQIGKNNQKIYVKYTVNTILSDNRLEIVDPFTIKSVNPDRSSGNNYIWAAPNPFNPSQGNMVIEYGLSNDQNNVEILIIDSAGRLVKRWGSGHVTGTPGKHRISNDWNGNNGSGTQAGRGVYLLYMKINNSIRSSWVFIIE